LEFRFVKRFSALFCVIALFQTTRVLADPLPAPTSEASKIDIMGLRLGMSPDEIKPILEAAQPGIQVKVQESTWPDGTRYVSAITGNWSIPNKNNPAVISRGELLDVHFSAPASGNKSFWITRQAAFYDGQEISKEATIRALLEKYGKPVDIGRAGIDYKWAYGTLNAYAVQDQFWRSWGECANTNFNSNCPDAFLTVNATQSLVPTLLISISAALKDNKYGLASLRNDERTRAAAKAAAEERAGKIAGAPRL
jgi:hypothetical protein